MDRLAADASRFALILAMTLVLAGCATWHSTGTERPAAFIARKKPEAVRLTLAESTLVLRLPSVRADSILGVSRTTKPPQMLAVPASDVRRLETLGPPKSAKIMLGTISAGALAIVIAAMIFASPQRVP
jgi:hypothetical protein